MTATTNETKIKDKAAKLHALAIRGIQGERDNAITKLANLVNEHPQLLGAIYPQYLSAEHAHYKRSRKPQRDQPSAVLERIWTCKMSITEYVLFSKIAKVFEACGSDSLMVYPEKSGEAVTVFMFGAKDWIWMIVSKFQTERTRFKQYLNTLTEAYSVHFDLPLADPAKVTIPDSMGGFYASCLDAFDR